MKDVLKEIWEGIREGFVGAMEMGTPILKIVVAGAGIILLMLTLFTVATMGLQ